ncbi:hypothetical protein, partial [Parabacteroides sp. AF48-14]|uniref:hypothetical protein n=1 Tax=Parabacteroides sp. AF48-14 TaxID=2292052 RepID=UPI001F31C87E
PFQISTSNPIKGTQVHRGRGSASKLQNRSLKRNGKREPAAEGLLYKTCFLISKDTPDKINVNPLFSRQKGAFSYDLAPYCHEEGLYRSDPEHCCSEVGLHIARSQPSER